PKALRLDGLVRDPNALHMAVLERVRQRAHDFDLLLFHLDYYPFSLFSRQPTPFVTTLHGRLDLPDQPFDVIDSAAREQSLSMRNKKNLRKARRERECRTSRPT